MTASLRNFMLVSIIIVLVTLGLGSWQLYKHIRLQHFASQQKEALKSEQIDEFEICDNQAESYYHERPIRIKGVIQPIQLFLYQGKKSTQGHFGYDVITPLRVSDGCTLLINRGWVTVRQKEQQMTQQLNLDEPIVVEGIWGPLPKEGWFTPPNDLVNNEWYSISQEQVEKAHYISVKNGLVYMLASEKPHALDTYLLPATRQISTNRPHLHYAITWYGLAITMVVIYVLFARKKKGRINHKDR